MNVMRRSLCFFYGLACAMQVYSACAAAPKPPMPSSIVWTTRPSNDRTIDHQEETLYRALLVKDVFKREREEAELKAGVSNEAALRDRTKGKLWFGDTYPPSLGTLICELNPQYCTTRSSSGPPLFNKYTENAPLVLPKLSFKTTRGVTTFSVTSDASLRQVIKESRACEKLDDACAAKIRDFNPHLSKKLGRDRVQVVLPADVREVELPLQPGVSLDTLKDKLQGLEYSQNVTFPVMRVRNAAAPGEGPPPYWKRLVEKIGGAETLGQLDPSVDGSPGNILLVDDGLYAHPAYLNYVEPPPKPFTGSDCPKVKEAQMGYPELEHATHLTGLLVAGLLPKKSGSQPSSRISYVPITLSDGRYASAREVRDEISEVTKRLESKPHAVVNLSWRLEADQQPASEWARFIDRTRPHSSVISNRLYVIAAGNEKQTLTQDRTCAVEPACGVDRRFTLRVTYVARNAQTKQFEMVDRGPGRGSAQGDRVELAVPADFLYSTLRCNQWGLMGGSSQATAVVSAVASRLSGRLAMQQMQSAEAVRNRLIYSAHIQPNLPLWGGVLDIDTALAVRKARLRFVRDEKEHECWVTTIARSANTKWRVTSDKTTSWSLSRIKRLVKVAPNEYLVMRSTREPGDEYQDLERTYVKAVTGPVIETDSDIAACQRIEVKELIDYVAKPYVKNKVS